MAHGDFGTSVHTAQRPTAVTDMNQWGVAETGDLRLVFPRNRSRGIYHKILESSFQSFRQMKWDYLDGRVGC